jgi:ribosomal protein S18 acetylase RimI-like enzyme
MPYQPYRDKTDVYQLQQGYALQRADYATFIDHWVIYRRLNEDFAQSFVAQQQDLEGVTYCFWITRNGRSEGGVVLLPNNIGDFFLIPPFSDAFAVLRVIIPLLVDWSLPSKPIHAQGISSQYLPTFQQFGFRVQESRHWMIRPTAVLPTQWQQGYAIRPCRPNDAPAIATLLHDAFTGGIGRFGKRTLSVHQNSVNQFFDSFEADSPAGQASIIVEAEELAGVCLVNLHKGLPAIQFTAVSPIHRRHGLATNMLCHALTMLAPAYNWAKLAVTIGNPAESVYHKMGFIAGDTLHTLIIEA